MATLHSTSSPQNPPQTFLDKKPPLLPRQSTSDVLSFTHIIANRLLPGQNVWDFFSPAPSPDGINSEGLSPISPSFGQLPSVVRRPSLAADAILSGKKHENPGVARHSTDASSCTSSTIRMNSLPPTPLAPSSLSNTLTTSATVGTVPPPTHTPKLQKRRSFAQSLKSSMISLGQLLSPTSSQSSRLSSPTVTGPPHYNILVLGSDSAPLASTLYKMSSLLPATTKIRHYQEISGFFVAYFRSNGSFSCSLPKTILASSEKKVMQVPRGIIKREGIDEVKSRRGSIQDIDDDDKRTVCGSETDKMNFPLGRSSEETLLQLKISPNDNKVMAIAGRNSKASDDSGSHHSLSSENSTVNLELDREEIILSDEDESKTSMGDLSGNNISSENRELQASSSRGSMDSTEAKPEPDQELEAQPDLNSSANASLSVHAFSLDTTWPVPRTLAQTFWFPFAHGIIYIVDATRKNDPRGVDHLVNARQFLASLIADPHFKRRDIPVVVFANKAGMDPETCYRVDEIAEILGCEEWEHDAAASTGGTGRCRPWCVKSTRSDGEGEGLRESVEWLKSRMGEIWKQ
ncbi:hypothetical protein BGX28_000972 [Mortierella sp. GBA30]|nr:hypothetical protein BGX28_000972 [Mortierella sp. GBA30]